MEFHISEGLVQNMVKMVNIKTLILKMVNNRCIIKSAFQHFGAVILNHRLFDGRGARPLLTMHNYLS